MEDATGMNPEQKPHWIQSKTITVSSGYTCGYPNKHVTVFSLLTKMHLLQKMSFQ